MAWVTMQVTVEIVRCVSVQLSESTAVICTRCADLEVAWLALGALAIERSCAHRACLMAFHALAVSYFEVAIATLSCTILISSTVASFAAWVTW